MRTLAVAAFLLVMIIPGGASDAVRNSAAGQAHWTALAAPRPLLPLEQAAGIGDTAVWNAWGAITCPSPGACAAVGAYQGADAGHVAVFRQSPAGWRSQEVSLAPPGMRPGGFDPRRGASSSCPDVPEVCTGSPASITCPTDRACVFLDNADIESRHGFHFCNNGLGCYLGIIAYESGSAWRVLRVTTIPGVKGVANSAVNGVACRGPDACIAVGSYQSADGPGAFVATQNANGWQLSALRLPKAAGSGPYLSAISCPDAAYCTAVGRVWIKGQASGLSISTTDGIHWSRDGIPEPARRRNMYPDFLSCWARGACVALDRIPLKNDNAEEAISVERGGRWSTRVAPLPAAAYGREFSSLVCDRTGFCAAAGTDRAFILWGGGSRWRSVFVGRLRRRLSCNAALVALAGPRIVGVSSCRALELRSERPWPVFLSIGRDRVSIAGRLRLGSALDNRAGALACSGAATCYAAGSLGGLMTGPLPLIEAGDSSHWAVAKVPLPANAGWRPDTSLTSVSCWRPGACVAVGDLSILELAKGRWSARRLPDGLEAAMVDGGDPVGVACPSAGNCVASGYDPNPLRLTGYVLRQEGRRWIALKVPPPRGHRSAHDLNSMGSIACGGGGGCLALGSYSPYSIAMVISIHGRHLVSIAPRSTRHVRAPAGFSLQAVACGAVCFAGGAAVTLRPNQDCECSGRAYTGEMHPVVVAVGPRGHSVIPLSLPPDALPRRRQSAAVEALSFVRQNFCVAAGTYLAKRSSLKLFIDERQNGEWRNAAAESSSGLVSDTYAAACAASGLCVLAPKDSPARRSPVAIRIGGRWHGIETRLPAEMASASCPDSRTCFLSANQIGANGKYRVYAIRLDGGRVSRRRLPLLAHMGRAPGTDGPLLSEMSCPSPTFCVAVGSYPMDIPSGSPDLNVEAGLIEEMRS
jgi:hypothetical protein